MTVEYTPRSFHVASALTAPVAGIVASIALAAASLLPNAAVAETPQIAPASAVQVEVNGIDLLARATGLTERQVRMVLGHRTAHLGYVAGYDFVDAHFRQVVGPELYARLKLDGELTPEDVQALAAKVSARTAERTASR